MAGLVEGTEVETGQLEPAGPTESAQPTEHSATESAVTKPAATEPAASDSTATEPQATESAATGSIEIEPAATEPPSLKRPALTTETIQRKKFKTEELPLSTSQRTAIDNLLYSFKKKGGFDSVRKLIWSEFNDGVRHTPFVGFFRRILNLRQ